MFEKLFGKKSETMDTAENEKEVDAGVDATDTSADQTQESNKATLPDQEQASQPAEPEQPTPEQPAAPTQWEVKVTEQVIKPVKERDIKVVIAGLRYGISPEASVRPAGTEEWKPLKDWDVFSKECNALLASTKPHEPTEVASATSEVKPLIEALQAEIQHLTGEMEYTKTFTANQKTQIDQLYKENREYKDGIIVKFKEALTKAVIEQLDFTDEKIDSYKEEKITQEEFVASCCEFANDFREVLEKRLDMTCFKPEPGDEIDMKKHKVLRTCKTGDPSQHKKIVVAKRYGYENEDGKIVRQAFVETYEYTVPPLIEQQSESAGEITPSEQVEPNNSRSRNGKPAE